MQIREIYQNKFTGRSYCDQSLLLFYKVIKNTNSQIINEKFIKISNDFNVQSELFGDTVNFENTPYFLEGILQTGLKAENFDERERLTKRKNVYKQKVRNFLKNSHLTN